VKIRRSSSSTERRPTTLDGPLAPISGATCDRSCNRSASRGASGDAPEYRLGREYEDVAAVVDAVAAASGEQADLYGHSHGGIVAFGAATLTANIGKLVLYEGWPVPDPSIYALPADVVRRMDELLAEGDRAGVVEALFRSVEEMSDEDMAALRSAPPGHAGSPPLTG
jgi:pimeloyl-ACP methyl ester carboxylesterase